MDLEMIRREYLKDGLTREALEDCPFRQFDKWMSQAIDSGTIDPTAMTLATVDSDGQPSQRIVLLKHTDDQGFVFYTNYGSQKAQDIEANPRISAHFPWHFMERQVKVLGSAEKISTAQSLKYFLSRPRDSQLAAWSSPQSHPITSRQFLLGQFEKMKEKFENGEVPLPDFWGGYRIVPRVIEFWQGGGNRLHDRFEYRLEASGSWAIRRLAP